MSTVAITPVARRIDAALDELQKDREHVLASFAGSERCARMAALYQLEAQCWSALFECTRVRVHWRAALAAEIGARRLARHWRHRAEMEAHRLPTSARFYAELAGGAS